MTQKAGTMVILAADGTKVEATVSGVPEVVAAGPLSELHGERSQRVQLLGRGHFHTGVAHQVE